MSKFISVLRKPDFVLGATTNSPYRFEEKDNWQTCPIKYDYVIDNGVGKITVYPSGSPVKYLKLRWRGDFSNIDSVYGDQIERSGESCYLEWRSVMPHRAMAWYCMVKSASDYAGYGVKTGADCFAFWQVDTRGITLFLNLCNGNNGTDLQSPLLACEVVELVSSGQNAYYFHKDFCKKMCDNPIMPKTPIFGVNNWYWAYGNISKDIVIKETEHLKMITDGVKNRPSMIIDDGWQLNRSYGSYHYIGGPWEPNATFKDMKETADFIREKGAKPGIWFRPLLTMGRVPEDAFFRAYDNGIVLDPSHPYTLEQVEKDANKIRNWGYEIIKHDFSTMDITGNAPLTSENHVSNLFSHDKPFYDNTKTTATIIKNLYKAIQNGAGNADVIGCNTIGHLTAGIHSIYRVGNDTSGRSFEWTRRFGVNSFMRLPQNENFFLADPDCAAFTDQVDSSLNLNYLEACAITGMTTLASITPYSLTDKEIKRINEIYKIADQNLLRYGIKNYDKTANPEVFTSADGKLEKEYDWIKAYEGSRIDLDWFN